MLSETETVIWVYSTVISPYLIPGDRKKAIVAWTGVQCYNVIREKCSLETIRYSVRSSSSDINIYTTNKQFKAQTCLEHLKCHIAVR